MPDALPIHIRSSFHHAGTIVCSQGSKHDDRSKGQHGTPHTAGLYRSGHHLLLYTSVGLKRCYCTKHKEKAYGRVLKARVSEVWRQTVLRGSSRVTDGSPPQGRMAAFVNHLYDDLDTPPYLRSFSADSAYYLFRIRTQDQNIIPTQDPRPNGVPQTQYGDRRCPLCPGRHLGSEAHMYLSCTVTSSLAHLLISELRVRFPRFSGTKYEKGNNTYSCNHYKCGENCSKIRGRTPRPPRLHRYTRGSG